MEIKELVTNEEFKKAASKVETVDEAVALCKAWLFILELLALLLFLFGVNIYQPPFIWLMYAVFLIMDVCITPRINKEK